MYRRIRELREDRDLTQEKVAQILHVSQSNYSRYENGYLDVPSGVLIALAQYYEVTTDYLLGLSDQPK